MMLVYEHGIIPIPSIYYAYETIFYGTPQFEEVMRSTSALYNVSRIKKKILDMNLPFEVHRLVIQRKTKITYSLGYMFDSEEELALALLGA